MKIEENLIKLSNSNGTGNELNSITKCIKNIINEFTYKHNPTFTKIYTDENLNLILNIKPEKPKAKITIDAHMDEIGFIVNDITKNGFLKLSPIGGIDKRLLESTELEFVKNEKIKAVIPSKAPHLSKANEPYLNLSELYAQVLLKEDNIKKTIQIGDYFVFSSKALFVNNYVTGKAIDNRAGCVCLIECIKDIIKEPLKNIEIDFLFSSKEECSNAISATKFVAKTKPDYCIVVDTSFAFYEGCNKIHCGEINKGSMVAICPYLNYKLSKEIINLAKINKIKFQREILNNKSGTNADGIALNTACYNTALISIPIKNMHSPVESVNINDIVTSKDLLLAFLKDKDKFYGNKNF